MGAISIFVSRSLPRSIGKEERIFNLLALFLSDFHTPVPPQRYLCIAKCVAGTSLAKEASDSSP
jgi:hypothetical protein